MAIDSNSAAQLVLKGYSEVSATAAAGPVAAPMAAPDFCTLWPKAKPILQVLVGIIAILPIPGGGTVGGGVLNGLILLGDQIFKGQMRIVGGRSMAAQAGRRQSRHGESRTSRLPVSAC